MRLLSRLLADTVLDNVVLKDLLGKEATDPPLLREGSRT